MRIDRTFDECAPIWFRVIFTFIIVIEYLILFFIGGPVFIIGFVSIYINKFSYRFIDFISGGNWHTHPIEGLRGGKGIIVRFLAHIYSKIFNK